jgi:predicted type IV restriction endonuclease
MKKQIESFIDELRSNKKLSMFDEASTKQAVVLRLLSFLGWDIFNVEEVHPDYSVNSYKVSYALGDKNSNKAFIQIKRAQEKLDNHQKSLIDFASREGVDISILTNGRVWWFYLISAEGDWQKKWFLSLDLLKQETDLITPQLIDLLAKDKISKGQALKTAKAIHKNKNQKIAADFVPKAWNQIISQPNKIFVELLCDTTEKLCGYKVESAQIERYLKKHLDNWIIENVSGSSAAPPAKVIKSEIIEEEEKEENIPIDPVDTKVVTKKGFENYEGKVIKSFIFDRNTYKVANWEEMLTTLCNRIAVLHKEDFEKVLWLSGRDKTYFSKYQDQLGIPEKIKKTDIYVETKLKPNEVVKIAKLLLAEYNYSPDTLKIAAE